MDLDRVAVDHRCHPSNCSRSRLDCVLQIDLRQRSAVMHDKLRDQSGSRSHGHEDQPHRHAGPASYGRASYASTLAPWARPIIVAGFIQAPSPKRGECAQNTRKVQNPIGTAQQGHCRSRSCHETGEIAGLNIARSQNICATSAGKPSALSQHWGTDRHDDQSMMEIFGEAMIATARL